MTHPCSQEIVPLELHSLMSAKCVKTSKISDFYRRTLCMHVGDTLGRLIVLSLMHFGELVDSWRCGKYIHLSSSFSQSTSWILPTITGKSIAVENVSGVATACVTGWCIVAVLTTSIRPQHAFINTCIRNACTRSIQIVECIMCAYHCMYAHQH